MFYIKSSKLFARVPCHRAYHAIRIIKIPTVKASFKSENILRLKSHHVNASFMDYITLYTQ